MSTKTQATHTVGPWRAGRPDMATVVDGVDSKWIYSADDQYVAVASGRINGTWDEVMANAQLIATAPELLKELQDLTQIAREYVAEGIPRLDDAINKAAMVALKARGELIDMTQEEWAELYERAATPAGGGIEGGSHTK